MLRIIWGVTSVVVHFFQRKLLRQKALKLAPPKEGFIQVSRLRVVFPERTFSDGTSRRRRLYPAITPPFID